MRKDLPANKANEEVPVRLLFVFFGKILPRGHRATSRLPTRPLRSWPIYLLLHAFVSAGEPAFKAPGGFTVSRAAGSPDIIFPMFATFDERGALFVAESSGLDLYRELQQLTRKCRISRLEDRDGDGVFERAQVFADNLVFPMGLVWSHRHGNKLFVADPPDLVTLADTDGDDRADQRTVILTGFGHTDNGSLHGLTFGPDGWLYLTLGEPDGYELKRPDGSVLSGKSGALLRCRADGSDVEVVSRGFENLVEVTFMPAGEIIGTDNWFTWPAAGVRDALVHLVEGGLYPLKTEDQGTPQLITGDPLPAIALYPAVAHSGFERYRGSVFPVRYRDSLFAAQFNTRRVVCHRLIRHGSTFRSEDEDFLTTDDPDFHPSDVLEDADGSLLVVDTGSWYIQHCPTGRIRPAPAQGGIYRIRFGKQPKLSDARGTNLDWTNPQEFAKRLADPRIAVGDRAAQALIRLGEPAIGPVARLLADNRTSSRAREQAIWILAQLPGPTALEPLHRLLKTKNADVVALTARALGRRGDDTTEANLLPLLDHSESRVRLAAAEALAHCGSAAAIGSIQRALMENPDRFLEHALIHALSRLAEEKDLLASLDHSHPRLQQAALRLLDQPPHHRLSPEATLSRLFVEDEALRRAARWVLRRHPGWVSQAIQAVRKLAARTLFAPWEEETLRELLVTFQAHPEIQTFIAATLGSTDSRASERLRVILLDCMARSDADKIPETWTAALRAALSNDSPVIQLQAVRAVEALNLAEVEDLLAAIVRDGQRTELLRIEALRALARKRPALRQEEFQLLLNQLPRSREPATRLAAAEIVRLCRLDGDQLSAVIAVIKTDNLIAPGIILAAAKRSELTRPAADELLSYMASVLDRGAQFSREDFAWVQANVPESAKNRASELLRTLERRQGEAPAQLQRFTALLQGGRSDVGKTLFFGKAACSACHQVGPEGGVVGPDLTRIGAIRSGRDLLESILLPSASFAQGYDTYLVTTRDGEEVTGVRVPQTDETFVLRDAGGTEHRFSGNRLKSAERAALSVMPDGLLSHLTRDEIRDLFAYLQELK